MCHDLFPSVATLERCNRMVEQKVELAPQILWQENFTSLSDIQKIQQIAVVTSFNCRYLTVYFNFISWPMISHGYFVVFHKRVPNLATQKSNTMLTARSLQVQKPRTLCPVTSVCKRNSISNRARSN
jgi:hypothetical protein